MSQVQADKPQRLSNVQEAPSDIPREETAAALTFRERRRPSRKRWIGRGLLLLGPLAVAATAAFLYYTGGRYVSTENAYVKADKVMISPEVSGLIDEVLVRSNQRVAKGDVLFTIDGRPYRIALAEVEAQLANTKAEILGLKAHYHQKESERALAQANLDFAKSELGRQSTLVASNTVSRSKFDASRRDYDVAKQQIAVIDQEMAQIRAELGGDPDLAAEAHPRYLEALAVRERARLDIENTVVRAPFPGITGNVPNPGQQVTGNGPLSAPVMSIVAEAGVWIEANYKETDLTYLQPGQTATVRVDAYPDRSWEGEVQSISQATGAEFSVIPPQNATGNWVKVVQRVPVRIALKDEKESPVLRAGMSTEVQVDTGHRRMLPGFLQTALSWFGVSRTTQAAAAER